jgi:hypothetical protein
MTEEQFLHEQLCRLHESFMKDAEPFLKRLAYIEAMKRPAPIFVKPSTLDPAVLEMLKRNSGGET